MTEHVQAVPAKQRLLGRPLIVAVVIALAAGCGYLLWHHIRIAPLESLGPVSLGMKEVDVSLAYGRRPDCGEQVSEKGKTWIYNTDLPCGTSVTFSKQPDGYRVSRVCSSAFRPHWIVNYVEGEPDILRRLGPPSHVSINSEGTGKIASFANYNVAFELENERVLETCVTRNMPVRYAVEYSG